LLRLLRTDLLINVLNEPILFIKYFHPTVSSVQIQSSQDNSPATVLINTRYGEQITLTVEAKDHELKTKLAGYMNHISANIKSIIATTDVSSFQSFIDSCNNQHILRQIAFVLDQAKTYQYM